jgi:hypothetical protein
MTPVGRPARNAAIPGNAFAVLWNAWAWRGVKRMWGLEAQWGC